MIRKSKLEGFVDRINGDFRPITADVFLTDFCNARCSYCRYNHETGKYIPFDKFKAYAKRLIELGVLGIILTGGGEPTINPDFEKITNWLEEQGIKYGINTNLIKSIKCNPVFLKVSIDAGNRDRYKAIRGVDKLEKVISNIKEFLDFKANKGGYTNVGVQCVATNRDDLLSFYDAIKGLDVDYIYIRPIEQVGGSDITKFDVHQWLSGINDQRINISYKFELKEYHPQSCLANWSVITVNHDGNVPYCCHFPNIIVGNIMDKDILSKKNACKVDMKHCEVPCRLSGANNYLEMTKVENDAFFV